MTDQSKSIGAVPFEERVPAGPARNGTLGSALRRLGAEPLLVDRRVSAVGLHPGQGGIDLGATRSLPFGKAMPYCWAIICGPTVFTFPWPFVLM